jgi:hypothetical protein
MGRNNKNSWQYTSEKTRFYFALVMVSFLCLVAAGVMIFADDLSVKAGAGVALWGVLRAVTNHMLPPSPPSNSTFSHAIQRFLSVISSERNNQRSANQISIAPVYLNDLARRETEVDRRT